MTYMNQNDAYALYREDLARRESDAARIQQSVEESARLQRDQAISNAYASLNARTIGNRIDEFRTSLYKALVAECVTMIASCGLKGCVENESFDYNRDTTILQQLAESWVADQDIYTINKKMNSTNFLSTCNLACWNAVEESCKKCKDKISEKDGKDLNDCFGIDDDDKAEFYRAIDAANADELVYTIKNRIADQNQEFLDTFIKDKMDVKNIMTDTKTAIDALRADNMDPLSSGSGDDLGESDVAPSSATTESLVESMVVELNNKAKAKIHKILNKPSTSLYEAMVVGLSTSAMKHTSALNEEFISEGTQIDTDGLRQRAAVMYTFLETLNTTKLEKITAEYISEVLDDIKKM